MRFIDNSSLKPSYAWLELTSTAYITYIYLPDIDTANPKDKRQDKIAFLDDKTKFTAKNPDTNKNKKYTASEVWLHLRNELLGLVDNNPNIEERVLKCWYSEDIEKSEIFIDHFRPKGMVKVFTSKNADLEDNVWQQIDTDKRKGYWFLAFNHHNFRLASKEVNANLNPQPKPNNSKAKGKSSFFPLCLDSPVAITAIGIQDEVIVLLDPCVQVDPELLRFNELGDALPSRPNNTWEYCRAKVSIEVYALNHHTLLIKDRREIWEKISIKIEMLSENLKKVTTNPKIKEQIKADIRAIKEAIDKKSKFSAVAIDCIRYFKNMAKEEEEDWLELIFPDTILNK